MKKKLLSTLAAAAVLAVAAAPVADAAPKRAASPAKVQTKHTRTSFKASQQECKAWQSMINDLGTAIESALDEDDLDGLDAVETERDQAVKDATGRGCSVHL